MTVEHLGLIFAWIIAIAVVAVAIRSYANKG